MDINKQDEQLDLVFRLFESTQLENLEYIFRGNFSTGITDNILALAEKNLDEEGDKRKIKKRVYFIMVEGLQNITRHQDNLLEKKLKKPGLFVIQRKNNSYYITTGNLIRVENIEELKGQLNKINSLEAVELKKYYRQILEEGRMSEKGGAGLGLVEIARKSGKKLAFDFKTINENFSYFYLHTQVPTGVIDNNDKKNETQNTSLDNIKKLHITLDNENILLNFSGIFNQENLINLLGIIEKQMKGTIILKMKVYKVMVEMLQNIVKHANNYLHNNIVGHYGIFFISEKEEEFVLTTGNYIDNSKVEMLKNHLYDVNNLNMKGLNAFYNQKLFDGQENKTKGLGIIDMRLKSEKKFTYKFNKVDENNSFFAFQICIRKQKNKAKSLMVEASESTPDIYLCPEEGIFIISNESYPEDAVKYYNPVFEWFESYIKNPNSLTSFEFKFKYYNTSSAKQIAKIMNVLEKLSSKSKVKVKWYYSKSDIDMYNDGLRYKENLDLNIKLIEDV